MLTQETENHQQAWPRRWPLRLGSGRAAGKFSARCGWPRANARINAKSIMGVMMLAAGKGSKVTLETKWSLTRPRRWKRCSH